jgi:hypothetical protein
MIKYGWRAWVTAVRALLVFYSICHDILNQQSPQSLEVWWTRCTVLLLCSVQQKYNTFTWQTDSLNAPNTQLPRDSKLLLRLTCQHACANSLSLSLTQKYITLYLRFRMYKNHHEMRTNHWYTVTSLLFKTLRQYLIDITSFRLSLSPYSLSVLFKCTNNFFLILIFWIIHSLEVMSPKLFL